MHNETWHPILGALQIQKLRFVRMTREYRVKDGARLDSRAVFNNQVRLICSRNRDQGVDGEPNKRHIRLIR